MNANAEVLLLQDDGSVILQVRDDKPGITNPGLISSFGGHIEEGEDPLDAAVREINEETNLGLKSNQLKFYRKCHKTKNIHGEDWDVYYFGAGNISTKGLKVYEGTGFTVIHNKKELESAKTTILLKQVLGDYLDGFRSYFFLPDIDEATKAAMFDRYLQDVLKGHKPSTFKQPIVLACTGLVAAGKSTVTSPLAKVIDCVTVSNDEIREMFFRAGYNFAELRSFVQAILNHLIQKQYNVFLDFNISTNILVLDKFRAADYKIFVIYANPPEAFIKHKILSGNMKHDLTFFTKDEHVYESMTSWKQEHINSLPELKQKYGIWYEVDTSRKDLDEVIAKMLAQFKQELNLV